VGSRDEQEGYAARTFLRLPCTNSFLRRLTTV
jgi:hypothetical protein